MLIMNRQRKGMVKDGEDLYKLQLTNLKNES